MYRMTVQRHSGTGLGLKDAIWIACLGLFAAAGLQGVIVWSGLTELYPAYAETIQEEMFSHSLAYKVLMYGAMGPIAEEIIYRWALFMLPVRNLPKYAILIGCLSALLFGLSHGNMIQFCYAFLFGILLSSEAWHYGTLAASIVSHVTANMSTIIAYSAGYRYSPIWALSLIPAAIIAVIRPLPEKRCL